MKRQQVQDEKTEKPFSVLWSKDTCRRRFWHRVGPLLLVEIGEACVRLCGELCSALHVRRIEYRPFASHHERLATLAIKLQDHRHGIVRQSALAVFGISLLLSDRRQDSNPAIPDLENGLVGIAVVVSGVDAMQSFDRDLAHLAGDCVIAIPTQAVDTGPD